MVKTNSSAKRANDFVEKLLKQLKQAEKAEKAKKVKKTKLEAALLKAARRAPVLKRAVEERQKRRAA